MTYPDSVQFLYALGNEMKTAKLGLERIRAVLDAQLHEDVGDVVLNEEERAFLIACWIATARRRESARPACRAA